MAVSNTEIADLFDRLADLLEIEDANPFRVRAYRNAARTVREYPRRMVDLLSTHQDLTELPGIGEDLAEKIQTIVEEGRLPLLEEVQRRVPPELSDLMNVEGLGPKRVKTLYQELAIDSIDDLKRAAANGEIRKVKGFGEKSEQLIREHLEQLAGREARFKLLSAEDIAKPLVDYLKRTKGIKELTIAGSYRRRKETVGDLDILVTAKRGAAVIERFVEYDGVKEVMSKGTTRSSVRLRAGLQVDLRVVPQVSYGAALHYFTGSKAHNIAVRRLGVQRGYKINEYGVFKGERRIAGKTEDEVYDAVDLPYIPPELREDRGEIEAAARHRLPDLIDLGDIRGDLHCHTNASDGRHSLEEMAAAAKKRGYDYLSINDHSRHTRIAHGLSEKRLREQLERIDALNERLHGIVVLKAIELDILDDGTLDLPNRILKQVDLTVCSIHYKFDLPRKKQTERILRAMDNRYFSILAHPTGRLINERPGYDIDLERIIDGARERGCFLELNAHPDRLDLSDEACKLARDKGVKIALSTDSHSIEDLDFMRFGVGQARRGWLSADDVLNTRPLGALRKLLRRA
jgi:DNA polymerase (family 10)